MLWWSKLIWLNFFYPKFGCLRFPAVVVPYWVLFLNTFLRIPREAKWLGWLGWCFQQGETWSPLGVGENNLPRRPNMGMVSCRCVFWKQQKEHLATLKLLENNNLTVNLKMGAVFLDWVCFLFVETTSLLRLVWNQNSYDCIVKRQYKGINLLPVYLWICVVTKVAILHAGSFHRGGHLDFNSFPKLEHGIHHHSNGGWIFSFNT